MVDAHQQLDVRRLRLLYELSMRGTLAGVATALNQSPSSVSQQLALLEKEAGTPLLRKVGRGVRLTSAGERLAQHGKLILDQLDRAIADLVPTNNKTKPIVGTIRLAVFQSAALAIMPWALGKLSRSHPDLRVTMMQREPESALEQTLLREFDLVIAEQYPHHAAPHGDGMNRQHLTHDRLRLALPEDRWLDVSSIEAARGLPWVMEPAPAASRHWTEQLCRSAGFEPDVRYETADLQAHVALVETGNAVSVLSGLMTTAATRDGSHRIRLVELPRKPQRTLFTATRTTLVDWAPIVACRSALAETVNERLATTSTW